MINNIKEYFPKIIQVRGLDYVEKGKIRDVFKDGKYYHANSMGSECYHTVIKVEDNNLVNGYCSCKAYRDSKTCKHMAGLALYVNSHEIKTSGNLEEVLSKLSKEQLLELVKTLIKNDKNRELVSFNFIDRLDEVMPSVKYYLDYLIKNKLISSKEYRDKLLDILLKICSVDLSKAYMALEMILEQVGELFKTEALRFIDISSIYYTNKTGISLISRLLDLDYLKVDLITVLIKNNKEKILKEILEYIDKKSLESIEDKIIKLKILLIYSKTQALKYARDNISLGMEFLNTYLSLESNPEETLLSYLMNYDDSFKISKDELVKAIRKTNKSEVIEQLNDFL